jgi:hypothetical protein
MKVPPKEIVNLPVGELIVFCQSEAFTTQASRYGAVRLIFSKPIKPAKPIKVTTEKPEKVKKGWRNTSDSIERREWRPHDPQIDVHICKTCVRGASQNWFIFGGNQYVTRRSWKNLGNAKHHVELQYAKWQNGEPIDSADLSTVFRDND